MAEPATLAAELAHAAAGPALQDVLRFRIDQIVVHGHDAEADSMMAIERLPLQAREFLIAAVEQITGVRGEQALPVARKNLARTAAMCLAAMDRLDVAMRSRSEELPL
ncbi:MAG: hypothetical protein ACXW27_08980 [Allosphingosinicella sp.]